MPQLDRSIGLAIRAARLAAGMSQARLAREAGTTRRHIISIENGSNFTVAILQGITRALPALRVPGVSASPE
jgi:transcriptional regulator with XRE-family HTH domain